MRFFHKPHLLTLLEVTKIILMLGLVILFVVFNARIATQADETHALAEKTNSIVKGQGDILQAIKQVTEDTRITASQQTSIIICMLQVPVNSRSTDLQTQCRNQSVQADQTTNTDRPTVQPPNKSTSTVVSPSPAPAQTTAPKAEAKTPPKKELVTNLLDKIKGIL